MQYQEFCERARVNISVENYEKVEKVYLSNPIFNSVSDMCAFYINYGGMAIIEKMLPMADAIDALKKECADRTDQIIELKSQIKELDYKLDRLTIIKDVYESYLDSDDLFADITLEQAALILSDKVGWVKKVEE